MTKTAKTITAEVETINLEWDAYANGFMAHGAGLPLEANPHKRGTEDYLQWRVGWAESAAAAG